MTKNDKERQTVHSAVQKLINYFIFFERLSFCYDFLAIIVVAVRANSVRELRFVTLRAYG